jgi:hypothetical protein
MAGQLVSAKSTPAVPSKATLSALRSIAEWSPASDGLMPEISRADIVAFEATLTPAPREAALVALMRTLAGFDPPNGNIQVHTDACLEMLQDVPLDIVRTGLKRVTAECVFTPKPAEIRARVVAELGERKRLVAKARVAVTMAERRRSPEPTRTATDEERQRVARLVSGLTVRPRVNPLLEAGPDRPETDDVNALRRVAAQAGVFRLPDIDHPEVQRWLRSA